MAEAYTDEEIANANKISAWAAERDRQQREARRAAYMTELRKVTSTAAYDTVKAGLRNLQSTATPDDNLSFHVASLIETMARIDREL